MGLKLNESKKIFETVSDLTIEHTKCPYPILSQTVLFLVTVKKHVIMFKHLCGTVCSCIQ